MLEFVEGDYIFRDSDKAGTEIVSIMFDTQCWCLC